MSNGVTNILTLVLIAACFWLYLLWKNARKTNNTIRQSAQQQSLVRHDERARALCRAIHILNPNLAVGVDYMIRHDTPEQEPYIGEWMADTARPTEQEINAARQKVTNIHHEDQFAAMRQAEYPSVEEQLNAAYEARQGNNTRQLEVDEKIRRVKEKYPKTDECG